MGSLRPWLKNVLVLGEIQAHFLLKFYKMILFTEGLEAFKLIK